MSSDIIIDINCDLGEGTSTQDCTRDSLLMPFISSCNIACGGHAGNKTTIIESLHNANQHQLKIGAHPGYPDKNNFGRKSMVLSFRKLEEILQTQIDCLLDFASEKNISVHHIKFHGALYNDIESDDQLAINAANIVMQFYPELKVIGLAAGKLELACRRLGLKFLSEGFIDRSYLSTGMLTPRSEAGALIKNHNQSIDQAIAFATNKPITTTDNKLINRKVDTICLHGDHPEALSLIKKINKSFDRSGIVVQ